MNKNILVFGASSSRNSINKKLASFTAQQLEGCEINLLDLNDFEMPIYSIDKEKENGIPQIAHRFDQHISDADGIIISFAEHNGAYTAAYKNIYDWVSRIGNDVWKQKPMFLLSTSPGARGGKGVLNLAASSYKFVNKAPIVEFSLPAFHKNFDEKSGIINAELKTQFLNQLQTFKEAIQLN